MLKKLGRLFIIFVAVSVILLSLGGIIGAWIINNAMSDATVKVFSVIQTGVEIADTAVGRVDALVQTARSEVQGAGKTVTSAASTLQENRPVLTALDERLESRLGTTVDKIQEALAPVHDALVTVDNAVSFANSLPFVQERAPRLDQLDQTLTQLSTLGADVQQLRTTLRIAVTGQADQLTQGLAEVLTDLTTRIDDRLADVQTKTQALQSEITALQARIQTMQSRLLLIYNLIALAATLLFIWVIYSQIVVIQHHWSRSPRPAPDTAMPEQGAPTANAKADVQGPGTVDEGVVALQSAEMNAETLPTGGAAPPPMN